MKKRGVVLLLVLGWLAWSEVQAAESAGTTSGPASVTVVEESAPAKPLTPAAEELAKKLQSPLSVQFGGTPLQDVLRYLEEKGKVNIILNTSVPTVDPLLPITLKLDNVTLASAIAWTARLAGLVYIARDEAVFLTTPGDLEPEWAEEMQTREQANDRLASKTWAPKLRAKLDDPTSFSFVNSPLAEALSFLSSFHKINIVLDPTFARAENTVTLEVNGISLRSALGWLLRLKRLDYTLLDEAIFVSSPERLRVLQLARTASTLDPRLGTVIDIDFSEATVQKALAALAEATGVNITLRTEHVPAVRVSVKMNHVTLEQALKKLAGLTGHPFAVSVGKEGVVIWLENQKATPAESESEAAQAPAKPETPPAQPPAEQPKLPQP
jgi:type II secretory pathway component HofQ